jgi:hypothetical protein
MQYQTAQNPATITSMGDGAPKRNELDGKPARFSRHFLWSTLVVYPSPQKLPTEFQQTIWKDDLGIIIIS